MSEQKVKCPFCFEPSGYWLDSNDRNYLGYDCDTCGIFYVSEKAKNFLAPLINNIQLLNIISHSIKTEKDTTNSWHLKSEKIPEAIKEERLIKIVEDHLSLPIDHSFKKEQIMRRIGEKLRNKSPFSNIKFNTKDLFELKIETPDEFKTWLQILETEGLTNGPMIDPVSFSGQTKGRFDHGLFGLLIKLTPKGWKYLSDLSLPLNSKKVFIAMQFDWKELKDLKSPFLDALKEACKECGFEADIVTEHHTDHIVDKIIAGIKTSRFVIVDFTFNNRGAYFEAGFARALGIPVIHTVLDGHHNGNIDEGKHLHFDIQQINYIRWDDTEKLKQALIDRINAVIK